MSAERSAEVFARTLKRLVNRLEVYAAGLVAQLDSKAGDLELTAANLAMAGLFRQQLTDELNRLGFQTAVRTLYSGVADHLEAETPPEDLPLAESMLAAFASGITRELDNAWFTLTGRIGETVEQAILTNAPISELVQGLAAPGPEGRESIRLTADLEAPMSQWVNWASAAVDTAVQALIRKLQAARATAAGVTYFIYTGTTIDSTRPFCRLMRDVVVTLADLRSIDTDPANAELRRLRGRQPSTVTTLGGFRCRHRLVATSEAGARREGLTFFAEARAELNRRAAAL